MLIANKGNLTWGIRWKKKKKKLAVLPVFSKYRSFLPTPILGTRRHFFKILTPELDSLPIIKTRTDNVPQRKVKQIVKQAAKKPLSHRVGNLTFVTVCKKPWRTFLF